MLFILLMIHRKRFGILFWVNDIILLIWHQNIHLFHFLLRTYAPVATLYMLAIFWIISKMVLPIRNRKMLAIMLYKSYKHFCSTSSAWTYGKWRQLISFYDQNQLQRIFWSVKTGLSISPHITSFIVTKNEVFCVNCFSHSYFHPCQCIVDYNPLEIADRLDGTHLANCLKRLNEESVYDFGMIVD